MKEELMLDLNTLEGCMREVEWVICCRCRFLFVVKACVWRLQVREDKFLSVWALVVVLRPVSRKSSFYLLKKPIKELCTRPINRTGSVVPSQVLKDPIGHLSEAKKNVRQGFKNRKRNPTEKRIKAQSWEEVRCSLVVLLYFCCSSADLTFLQVMEGSWGVLYHILSLVLVSSLEGQDTIPSASHAFIYRRGCLGL